jgi:signal transduction histidine kinase/CheY-like chemotaxis protein
MASPEPGLPEEALAGMAQGVAGHVLSSGRAEVVNDLSRDDRWVEGAFPPGSLLCAPLQAKNATPGVLAAHSRKPGRFSAEDLSLFKTLAASAASALENARLYENLARAKEAAEAADRAKTEFLETLSHEIRTPLNAILGMTDLLHDSELDADQRKCLSVARQAGESLLAMINDILELIRLQVRSGKQDLAPKRFDLEELVEEACLAMAGKAQAKGLDMAYFIHPGLPTQLSGDPERLRQVLLCLLDNAVKFTEAGEVRIAVSKTRSKPNAVGAHTFRFSVTDTGPGIPESQHKTIFHRFTQADSSTTRRHGGAGVGLAIAKRLVELMGGRIRVKSEPGHGSTFNFTVKLGVSPAGGDQHLPAPELEGRRVLLADPAPASRDMLAQSLERLGLEVRSEPDVKKALELAEQAADGDAPWDAVLLDACRHEKEALRVGARIRELLPRTPLFLLLPRHDQTARIQRLARLGFENHLLKPVSPAPLRSRLLAALAGG